MASPSAELPRLSSKGRQTQRAIADAARKLFTQRGFHGTTLADITSAAGKSPAVFYRYFSDKEQLLAVLAEDFLRDVVELPNVVELPKLADGSDFFDSAVTVYWNMFKPNIGIMVAVEQLAATEPRFAELQNRFRRYGMDIISASVRHAQQKGFAGDLDADHTALAIALLFERFTGVCLAHGISDDAAVRTLATIWKKTLYGDMKEI